DRNLKPTIRRRPFRINVEIARGISKPYKKMMDSPVTPPSPRLPEIMNTLIPTAKMNEPAMTSSIFKSVWAVILGVRDSFIFSKFIFLTFLFFFINYPPFEQGLYTAD